MGKKEEKWTCKECGDENAIGCACACGEVDYSHIKIEPEKKAKPEYCDKYVKYVFTEDELKEISDQIAAKVSEKETLEHKKKEVASSIKAEIESTESIISRAAKHLRQKHTYRTIECEIVKDYKNKKVHFKRMDTGEIATAESRDMKNDELQMYFDGMNAGKSKG